MIAKFKDGSTIVIDYLSETLSVDKKYFMLIFHSKDINTSYKKLLQDILTDENIKEITILYEDGTIKEVYTDYVKLINAQKTIDNFITSYDIRFGDINYIEPNVN